MARGSWRIVPWLVGMERIETKFPAVWTDCSTPHRKDPSTMSPAFTGWETMVEVPRNVIFWKFAPGRKLILK